MRGWSIRPAVPADAPEIFRLVQQLAEYEKLSQDVIASPADFHQALFGSRPTAEALLAEADGRAVGLALYFSSFSTFLGRSGIYLEDIFVEPEWRGRGIGSALMREVAKIAVSRRCGRLEWSVLTWNQPSIEFYERLGAVRMEQWRVYRLTGAALARLAESGS